VSRLLSCRIGRPVAGLVRFFRRPGINCGHPRRQHRASLGFDFVRSAGVASAHGHTHRHVAALGRTYGRTGGNARRRVLPERSDQFEHPNRRHPRSFDDHRHRGPSGRKRFNVLGAIDAVTHELTTVCNETTINAEAIGELLKKLSDRYVGLPMTLVLDNARYQRCAVVQELARLLRVDFSGPPASPHLKGRRPKLIRPGLRGRRRGPWAGFRKGGRAASPRRRLCGRPRRTGRRVWRSRGRSSSGPRA